MSERWSWRAIPRALGCALVALASPALATDPERIEQLESEGRAWQAEFSLLASRGSAIEPSFELLRRVGDHLAIGIEVEGEDGTLEGFAPTIEYHFSDPSARMGVGVVGQIEFATDFTPVGAEARLVLERQARRWWGQGNIIVHAEREDGRSAASLAYSWRISRAMGKTLWLGGEGSGHVAQLGGLPAADRGHYVGPALTIVREMSTGSEIEFNASFLQRIAGEGPRGTLVLSAQIGL